MVIAEDCWSVPPVLGQRELRAEPPWLPRASFATGRKRTGCGASSSGPLNTGRSVRGSICTSLWMETLSASLGKKILSPLFSLPNK